MSDATFVVENRNGVFIDSPRDAVERLPHVFNRIFKRACALLDRGHPIFDLSEAILNAIEAILNFVESAINLIKSVVYFGKSCLNSFSQVLDGIHHTRNRRFAVARFIHNLFLHEFLGHASIIPHPRRRRL